MRLHFQASFFADLASIEPSPDTTLKIFQALTAEQLGVIPTTVNELAPGMPGPIPRLRFVSQDARLDLIVGRTRLDFIKKTEDWSRNDLGSASDFSEQAEKCLKAVIGDRQITATRLAFIATAVLSESDKTALDQSYRRLFVPPSYYVENAPIEWTFRSNARNPIRISGSDELCNIIFKAERGQGAFISGGAQERFDRILTEVDINTVQETLDPRFHVSALREFIAHAAALEEDICKDLGQQLGVRP